MRTTHDVAEWCRNQVKNPTQDWQGLCLSFTRQAWGLPVIAPNAKAAWQLIPHKHRHHTPVDEVPFGAPCFDPRLGRYGHAWVAAAEHNGHRLGWSTDYKRRGRVDYAPLALERWTHDDRVLWADWLPHIGRLPLG